MYRYEPCYTATNKPGCYNLDRNPAAPYPHSMTERADKLQKIYKVLKGLYPKAATFLVHRNSYELMIAVILSARTTDDQVNRVTPKLFKDYPNPPSLMKADVKKVERIIFPTGFYKTKARNIIGAAAGVVEKFGGTVPRSMNELLSLPGVGRKSANVIRGHCFDKPAVIVDTHFSRVVRRLGLSGEEDPGGIEKDIVSLCPEDIQTDFSMIVNIHGRRTCTARKPDCSRCPVSSLCSFLCND